MSDKVYWQVADARRRASGGESLFKVDSAGKRRLLYCCHLSNAGIARNGSMVTYLYHQRAVGEIGCMQVDIDAAERGNF